MILLDSSFLIAFYNRNDVHHAKANRIMDSFLAGAWGQGLLLEYVFLEVTTVLLSRCNLSVAASVGSILLQSKELDFVPCSEHFANTWAVFCEHKGTLSFTDCAIVAVAEHYSTTELATFDSGFRKWSSLHVVDGY